MIDNSTEKYSSIQVVRAIAALMVVLFHSHYLVDNFPPGLRIDLPFVYRHGYLGVDIFFVVSGFIIAHVTSAPNFSLPAYFIKRFFRIYPIYWLFCVSALVSYLKFGFNIGQSLEYSTIYASFLAAPTETYPIYPVGWSLTHEVMFYLTAGIVLSYSTYPVLLIVLLLVGFTGLAMQLNGVALAGTSGLVVMKFISPYQLNFFAGVLIYITRPRLLSIGVFPAVVGVLLCFWVAANVPSFASLFNCIGSAFFIIAFLNAEGKGYLDCGNGPCRVLVRMLIVVGNASFSLYLVHWIFFRWLGYEKTIEYFGLPSWSAEIWRYFGIFVALTASLAMHYYLEKPIVRFGGWIAKLTVRTPKAISLGSRL